jgi:hypothetical protein
MRSYFNRSFLLLGLVLLASPASASSDLFVSTSGYVGVGTTSPIYSLDVLGPTTTGTAGRFSSGDTDSTNVALNNTSTGGAAWYVGTAGSSNVAGEAVGDFHIGLYGTGSFLLITTAGNIAVPYNLSVTGNLTVTGVATLGTGSTAVTQSAGDTSTDIATDQFVNSTALTLANGTTAVTQTSSDSSTDVATDQFVQNVVSSGSGSGMVLLDTVNASGASGVVFNSTYITSTYNKYVIEFDGAYCGSNGDSLEMVISTNNGSSYLGGGYACATNLHSCITNSQFVLDEGGGMGGSSNVSIGQITFAPAASANFDAYWQIAENQASAFFQITGAGVNTGTTTVNNVKIYCGSSNITGNFHLYGLKGT